MKVCVTCGLEMVPKGHGSPSTEIYSRDQHKACYERTRRAANNRMLRRIPAAVRALNENYSLAEYDCFWCQEGLYPPREQAEREQRKVIVGWYLDEAVCRWHLEFAYDWARYLLKDYEERLSTA